MRCVISAIQVQAIMEMSNRNSLVSALCTIYALIDLELCTHDLYTLYHEFFPEDRDFWKKIADEEQNHAALLQAVGSFFEKGIHSQAALEVFLGDQRTDVQSIIAEVRSQIQKFTAAKPSRDEACRFAIHLEGLAGEAHFHDIMNAPSDDEIIQVIQGLGREDLKHAERIRALLSKG